MFDAMMMALKNKRLHAKDHQILEEKENQKKGFGDKAPSLEGGDISEPIHGDQMEGEAVLPAEMTEGLGPEHLETLIALLTKGHGDQFQAKANDSIKEKMDLIKNKKLKV